MRASRMFGVLLAAAATGGFHTAATAASSCDRACLIRTTDRYLAALIAHDPKAAPLAPGMAFVENLKRLRPGEGLWKTATGGKTRFSIVVPDPQLQQVGWLGVIEQDDKPVMLALRLKLSGGKIVQAEHIVAAPMRGMMTNLVTPRAGLVTAIPAPARLPHDRLIRIGATYYDALDDNDGAKSPFAADCQRRENGITTAGEGVAGSPVKDDNPSPIASDCKGQIDSQSFLYIEHIVNRRLVAADPVTGLVMGFSQFQHSFTNLPYPVKHLDGSTSERNAGNMPYKPFDMPAAHIFKVGPEGQIHEIEAVGAMMPFKSPSGW